MSEIDILKATICMKDHEILNLHSELERRSMETQTLATAIERLEKTMAASYDRLLRRLERESIGKRSRR